MKTVAHKNRFFTRTIDGDYYFEFGKHDGESLSQVAIDDCDYLDWIIWKSDLPDDIRELVADSIEQWRAEGLI